VLAVISGLITYFASSRERRKRKVLLAIFTPFIGLFTLYFTALIGSIIVSEYKGIDMGIGDAWYAQVSTHCRIVMINLPEQGYIECDGKDVTDEITEVKQIKGTIYTRSKE